MSRSPFRLLCNLGHSHHLRHSCFSLISIISRVLIRPGSNMLAANATHHCSVCSKYVLGRASDLHFLLWYQPNRRLIRLLALPVAAAAHRLLSLHLAPAFAPLGEGTLLPMPFYDLQHKSIARNLFFMGGVCIVSTVDSSCSDSYFLSTAQTTIKVMMDAN